MYKGNLHAPDLRPYFHTHRSSPALRLEAALGGVALEFGKGNLHALEMHRGRFFCLAQVKLSHLASIATDTQIAMLFIAKDIASSVYIDKATSVALSTAPADYYLLADPRLAEAPELCTVVPCTGSVSSTAKPLLVTNRLCFQHLSYDHPKYKGDLHAPEMS